MNKLKEEAQDSTHTWADKTLIRWDKWWVRLKLQFDPQVLALILVSGSILLVQVWLCSVPRWFLLFRSCAPSSGEHCISLRSSSLLLSDRPVCLDAASVTLNLLKTLRTVESLALFFKDLCLITRVSLLHPCPSGLGAVEEKPSVH